MHVEKGTLSLFANTDVTLLAVAQMTATLLKEAVTLPQLFSHWGFAVPQLFQKIPQQYSYIVSF